jgi:hypothetical protein
MFPDNLNNPNFTIGRAAAERPQLSLMGMNIIMQHSKLDAAIYSLGVTLLGKDPKPALAALAVINKNRIRNQAILAAADLFMSGEQKDLLSAVLAVTEGADKDRNKIAHHLWATETQLPDSVILIDTDKYAMILADMHLQKDSSPTDEEALQLIARIRTSGRVYKKADFERILQTVERAFFLVTSLSICLERGADHPEGATQLSQLKAAPEIQEWLCNHRKSDQ